jgi:hypothetical protein
MREGFHRSLLSDPGFVLLRGRTVTPVAVAQAEAARRPRQSSGGVVWQAHWAARIGGRLLMTHLAGGRKPALPLRPAQLQRASQQLHRIGARRPHSAGFKVPHRALAQLGAGR